MIEVANTAQGLYLARLCQSASAFLVVYDHVLTFDREVALVWKQEYTIRTAMFLVNRYIGEGILITNIAVSIASHGAESVNGKYLSFQAWGTAIITWSVQAVLQYRIHAMHHYSMVVLIAMNTAFALEVIAMSAMLGLFFTATGKAPIDASLSQGAQKYFYAFTLPIISFECVSLGFLLWGGIRHILEMKRTLKSWSVSSFIRVPLRDAVIYFATMTAVYSVAGSMWLTRNVAWIEAPQSLALAATVITGSRLVLNLRLVTHTRLEVDELPRMPTHFRDPSPITFSTPHANEDVELDHMPALHFAPRTVRFTETHSRASGSHSMKIDEVREAGSSR
ncbi:hypothetical protein BV22DRAFT_85351 [Leucogyrophana mollusca]|uniref:Uncharacterized protein n=1 Tax=Leucogyrophana mollusca TaxID=85980 RepID=A0ACB8BVQ2_9AGAM|nr:hypothetical protein BV22DRAFT_85351 [Leucogyrophana mollusca]